MLGFKKRTLREALRDYKKVKVKGVIFHIRKLTPLDYIANAKVMLQNFETYSPESLFKKDKFSESDIKKVKEHYRHVLLQGVVKPELSAKKDPGEKICVDEILNNWELAINVYNEIIKYTYGKKKTILSRLIKKNC